jgi:hypothetical protein
MKTTSDWTKAFFIGKLADATGVSRQYITIRFLRTLKNGEYSGRFVVAAPGYKETVFRLTTKNVSNPAKKGKWVFTKNL